MTAVIAKQSLPVHVVEQIRSVVGPEPRRLHEPCFKGHEWTYLKECLDSTFVSSVGEFVDRFERELADYTGAKAVVVVVNGTAALEMCIRLAGVDRGDEVLVPALTFAATANAVSHCGAVPHFVDSEERTLGMDPAALRAYLRSTTDIRGGKCINRQTGRVIKAVVPMHTFGHPVDIEGIARVAADFGLVLIEDAAESLGSTYQGRHMGTFGLLSSLSFNGNKTITTGGGGAIMTNDADLARRAKHLTTTARRAHKWEYTHDEVGFNYRMPNLNAALGCAQLESLPEMIRAKRTLFERYRDAFTEVNGISVFQEPTGCSSNYWLQTLVLDADHAGERDEILAATNAAGFMTRPAWTLMHRMQHFSDCPRMELPVAESLERRLINVPSSAFL